MKRDTIIIKKRKKVWDLFGWGYMNQPGRLFKNRWLNDLNAFINRQERRRSRHTIKLEINKELERMINNET